MLETVKQKNVRAARSPKQWDPHNNNQRRHFCSMFTRGTKVVHRLSGPEHPPVRQKLELLALLDATLFSPLYLFSFPSFLCVYMQNRAQNARVNFLQMWSCLRILKRYLSCPACFLDLICRFGRMTLAPAVGQKLLKKSIWKEMLRADVNRAASPDFHLKCFVTPSLAHIRLVLLSRYKKLFSLKFREFLNV